MKNKLVNFIQRYNIGGIVNSVCVTSKDKTLSTKFISDDRSAVGYVNEYGFNMDDSAIGIFDTDQLLRMLHILNDNVEIDLVGEDGRYTKLALSDGNIKANFLLCDLSIVDDVSKVKFPDPGMTFHLTPAFCNNFVKAYSALTDNEFFTIEPDGQENVKVIVGPYNNHSMNIILTTPVDTLDDFLMSSVKLRASVFKDIIVTNKNFEQGMVHVNERKGLIKLAFHKTDEFSSQYYLVAEQQDD